MNFIKTLMVTIIFGIVVTGCGVLINPTADIHVKQGADGISAETGMFDFGRVEVNTSSTVIFTIQNNGNTCLKLTGSPLIEILGADSNYFIVTSQPSTPISPDKKTTFRIKFSPIVSKFYLATVSIQNNDMDKTPYTFTIKGRGIIIDINVRQDTQNIPSYTGVFDFGSIYLGNPSLTLIFTIESIGSKLLHLTGTPDLIEISGSHASMFIIDQTATKHSLNPGESTTFSITLAPTGIGRKSAKISIANDDPDENPYIFTITGVVCNIPFDFNGDGFDDVIIGVSADNAISGNDSDFAYLFLGSDNYSKNVNCNEADTIFKYRMDSYEIRSYVATSGDINNDGYGDIIIGNYHDTEYGQSTGCVLIYFGRTNPPSELNYTDADVKITGIQRLDGFGWVVSSAGDFNKDGINDIIIAATGVGYGSVFVFFGKENWESKFDYSKADLQISGNVNLRLYGTSVSSAGDFNNDGYDDLIVGTPATNCGNAYIIFGKSHPPKIISVSDADVTLTGENRGDYFGETVSKAGDINNDGYDDVVVGARRYDNQVRSAGCAYVYFGRANPSSTINPLDADIRILGDSMDAGFASCVSNAGDINNDGFSDLIIGESGSHHPNYPKDGNIYIFYGSSNPQSLLSLSNADVRIHTIGGLSLFKSISSAGDFNGDKIDDVIFTNCFSLYNDAEVHVLFGKSNLNSSIYLSNTDIKFQSYDPNIFIGWSISGGE